MNTEDPIYNAQTVEDETMLLCLGMNGEGMSNEEIAQGLWPVMCYFAESIEDKDTREGVADLLESLVHELRTLPPRQRSPEERKNLSEYRLYSQAVQEGRLPRDRP